MVYSQEQMEFAHKVVFRLTEILKICPNVDPKFKCWTALEKTHSRCYDLMVLIAEITNLPEYLEYLSKHPDTQTDPYGWITSYPPAKNIVEEENIFEETLDIE